MAKELLQNDLLEKCLKLSKNLEKNKDIRTRFQNNYSIHNQNFDACWKNSIRSCHQRKFYEEILWTRRDILEKPRKSWISLLPSASRADKVSKIISKVLQENFDIFFEKIISMDIFSPIRGLDPPQDAINPISTEV